MTIYCDNQQCEYFEDGYCEADRLDLNEQGVCMTVRFKPPSIEEDNVSE